MNILVALVSATKPSKSNISHHQLLHNWLLF
jgi:hypothetical protein